MDAQSVRHRTKVPPARRRAEMVDTEGIWCCIVRRPATVVRAAGEEDWRRRGRDRTVTGDEDGSEAGSMNRERTGSDVLLRSRELEALIKQGIANGSGIVVERSSKGSPFRLRLSPGRVSPISDTAIVPLASSGAGYIKSSSGKMITPASPPVDKNKASASPTLLEMMALEQEMQQQHKQSQMQQSIVLSLPKPASVQDKVNAILLLKSPGNQFNDPMSSDVRLTLTGKDGFSVSINVHRQILTAQSRFFAAKFSDWWSKQHRSPLNAVEISDCEDVDLYLQTIKLMYCRDLKRSLLKENVSRVVGILKVCAAILFEVGVVSCLEYLEAVPWPEEEEEKITTLISQLQLDSVASMDVLKRLSAIEAVQSQDIFAKLLDAVIKGTDERARREMKSLVARMLRTDAIANINSTEAACNECLYRACEGCIETLSALLNEQSMEEEEDSSNNNSHSSSNSNNNSNNSNSSSSGSKKKRNKAVVATDIGRQADNLRWILEMLIERGAAERFVRMWAKQRELAAAYGRVAGVYRYGVSSVTGRVCMGIGKGEIVVGQEIRYEVVKVWLQGLVDDFGWLQRLCCKGNDKKALEDGVCETILTLPLKQQQGILMAWFDCFSKSSNGDCPNLHKAFEVWWRRTFVRPFATFSSSSSSSPSFSSSASTVTVTVTAASVATVAPAATAPASAAAVSSGV